MVSWFQPAGFLRCPSDVADRRCSVETVQAFWVPAKNILLLHPLATCITYLFKRDEASDPKGGPA